MGFAVTLLTADDDDNLEHSLKPAERYICEQMRLKPNEPVSFANFKDRLSHGTIRNAFSGLKKKGLIKLYCRSSIAFYVLASSNVNASSIPVTVTHTVDRKGVREIRFDFYAFLDSIEFEELSRVHDIAFDLTALGLYDRILQSGGFPVVAESRDIQFASYKWSNNRLLKVNLHHNGKVSCYLKSSECPIEVSMNGLVDLASFLGSVRLRLTDALCPSHDELNDCAVPDVGSWVVVQWHYGKDGIREISGPAFNVTFKTWADTLGRIYMRKSGQLFRARLETIEEPKKSLPQAFADKMKSNGNESRC